MIILVTGPLGYYKETQFETVPKKEIQKIQETGLARVLKKDVKWVVLSSLTYVRICTGILNVTDFPYSYSHVS